MDQTPKLMTPSDEILFEGLVSLRAVLATYDTTHPRKIKRIIYSDERVTKKGKEYKWLKHEAERKEFSIEIEDSSVINSLACGTTHGGILFYCENRKIPFLEETHIKEKRIYYMIEGVEDPFNFGYAIRTIYASGADGLIMSPRNWMSAAGIVCKSSAGASEIISSMICDTTDTACEIFRKAGYKIVCADIENSISIYDADLSYPLFVIIGGEKRGISRKVLNCSDAVVRLDYGRDFSAALSTASAASIISYEVFRQNRDHIKFI